MRLVDAGREIIVHEAAAFAGGRCRSYLDPTLGLVIDNGNHLLLSGNHEALDYLDRIGARGTLHDPGAAVFDLQTSRAASAGGSISARDASRGGCSIERSACPARRLANILPRSACS